MHTYKLIYYDWRCSFSICFIFSTIHLTYFLNTVKKENSFIKSKEIVVSAVYWGIWQEMAECSYKTLYFAGFKNVKQIFNCKNFRSPYNLCYGYLNHNFFCYITTNDLKWIVFINDHVGTDLIQVSKFITN